MYAAAGGASLASRQARQKQRQTKKTEKLAQLRGQLHASAAASTAAKASAAAATPAARAQSKPFHNLPANYQNSAVKLSRVERNALRPPVPVERRHSTSNHLKEPARARIRQSPSMLIPVQNHVARSPSARHLPHDPERRCSLVRQYEEADKARDQPTELSPCLHCERAPDGNPLLYTDLHTAAAAFGSMDYPFSECSQGRAAWQERERERRCSLSEAAHNHRVKQTEAHHRWMKRNRIHDTSYGGSSDEEDFFSVYYQSAAANALLYVGLGTTVIGLVIWFVGTGEKGFKTLELRLIGPTLIALGLLCCVVRVLLCICPSTCFRRRKKTRLKPTCPHRYGKTTRREHPPMTAAAAAAVGAAAAAPADDFVLLDHSSALLAKSKKRVSIAPTAATSGVGATEPPAPGPSASFAACSTATTVFLQHEKDRSTVHKPIPTIEVPDFADFNGARVAKHDSLIELQNLELCSLEVSSVSSGDSDSITIIEAEVTRAPSKLVRTRQPKLASDSSPDAAETSLSTAVVPAVPKCSHSGIVLSPSKLGQ